MTYPTNPITISYSYSDFQLGQGNNAFPGTQIDADLAVITNGLNSLNTFVRGVTRSDGKLANQSVGPDQLSSALLLGFTLQGPWVSGFSYSTADGVVYNGNFYRALFAHVSAAGTRPDLSPATWQFLYSVGSVVGAMTAAVYDPQNKIADAFARANHTGTQAISTVAGLAAALGAYGVRGVNYTAVASDNNAEFRFTASVTVALTAAATLGAGWAYTVIATAGDVVIDPNAAETINGLATLTVPSGTTAKIICDGTNFFTVFKQNGWEPVGGVNGDGIYTLAGAASLALTNLSAFSKLRLSGKLTTSVAANLQLRTSTNNGSSYDSGASDYAYQVTYASGSATPVAGGTNATAAMILTPGTNDLGGQIVFNATIEGFNKAEIPVVLNQVSFIVGGFMGLGATTGQRGSLTARNALQIFPTAGTLTGRVLVEGIRG